MSAHYVNQIAPNYIHSTMQSNSSDDSFTFTVGKLDAGMAILIGEKASLIEFPSLLLPPGVSSGSVVNIRVMRNDSQERRQKDEFDQLQEDILHTFGQQSPKAPNLRLRNVTQTSVTLEWDRLTLATATLLSLDIYRNGQRLAPIPNPLHNTSTKLSGLDLNAEYTFHLVLKTTAGTFSSPLIKTRTHTINDTSGISVCFGHVHDPSMLEAAKVALGNMKAKWSDRIQIDTTHYVCTDPRNPGDTTNAGQGSVGAGYGKAMQLSIPAVLPHWIFACWEQKKMVGISAFYLDQDPPNASTVRGSIDTVLGKTATSSSNNNTTPPPPLEKDTSPAVPSTEEMEEGKPAPFEAEDSLPPKHQSQLPNSFASQASSGPSALGLNLTDPNEEEEEATPKHPSPPILTTTAPSDDGDVELRTHEVEEEPESVPAPPQVVITPSESQENISTSTPPQAEEENVEEVTEVRKEGQHEHAPEEDPEAEGEGEGEMDDVSLGGGTNAGDGEDDSREKEIAY